MKVLLTIALAVSLFGCTLPQTTVRSGSSQPTLIVKGAPAGSLLYVDGLSMGPADKFNAAPNVLVVLPGAHQIEIRQESSIVFSEKVLSTVGESHTVSIPRRVTP